MGIDLSSSQAGEFLPCQCCCTVPASQRKATVVTGYNEQRELPHHFSEAKTCYRRNDERQPATQPSRAGPRNDGAMLIAARFVRADPEVGTILRRRQFLVADRHRRVHM